MTKLIYFGCLSGSKYKGTCENATKIIKFLDDEYQIIDDPPCCGALAHQVAIKEDLENHVKLVNDWFKSNDITKLMKQHHFEINVVAKKDILKKKEKELSKVKNKLYISPFLSF